MAALVARHDPAAQARYQALKQLARTQRRVLAGTPGNLKKRTRRGTEYWVREHIRVDGKKDDEHLGTVDKVSATTLEAAREEIELAKALAAGSSALRVFGYQRVDRKIASVLTALFNRGLFEAGLTLVGSHAYGALLNDCGATAAGYRTQDIDLARGQPLGIALPGMNWKAILDESDLAFVPIPGMPSRKPSTSFKLRGADGIAVDLLIPGATIGEAIPVAELESHAQSVPFLDFLVAEPVDGVVLSPNQVVPVKLPSPERFVIHKFYSSQSRATQRDKIRKDLEQAGALAAVLEEDMPGRLYDAFRELPLSGRSAAKRGALAASKLPGTPPESAEALRRIASR